MGTFDKHQKIWDEYNDRADARASKYNKDVRSAYSRYRNRTAPIHAEKYRNEIGKMQRAYVKSKAEFEYGIFVEKENFVGATAILDSQLKSGLIAQPEYDYRFNGMAVDAKLAQADRSMDMGDYLNASVALGQVDIGTLDDDRRTSYQIVQKRIYAEGTKQEKLVTSEMIVLHAQGKLSLSVLDGNARRMDPLRYQAIRASLTNPAPQFSDPGAVAAINQAISDMQMEIGNKEQAHDVYLENEHLLSQPDRNKFATNISEEFRAGIGKAKGVIKDWGKGLISKRFQEFDPHNIKKFVSADPEEQRRYELEWRNRNQYNEAVDQWGREQGDKAFTSQDYKRACLSIYDDFEKVKNLTLDQMEAVLGAKNVLGKTPKHIPKRTSLAEKKRKRKKISDMTEQEKRARFQELNRKRNE